MPFSDKEKRREYQRKWREINREKYLQSAKSGYHRNKHKHKHKERDRNLKNKYGINTTEYSGLLTEQSNLCAICGIDVEEYGKNFHVDHCHKTGKIRGLLCGPCNTRLGWYELHPDSIARYLDKGA